MGFLPVTRPRVISDFEGHWRVTRAITHADGTVATFSGEAAFEPDPQGGLDYTEDGMLSLPTGQSMRATRRYLWADDLSVFFDDGRPFHQVPREGGAAEHYCAPDTYRVTYDFANWPEWQAIWDVTGPKKAYRMVSNYAPAAL